MTGNRKWVSYNQIKDVTGKSTFTRYSTMRKGICFVKKNFKIDFQNNWVNNLQFVVVIKAFTVNAGEIRISKIKQIQNIYVFTMA